MIQIYDKEFSQKRIATMMYVYLSCGGKLTKDSFDNISYKLYHYMEDLFIEDTLCITEEVKSRIETFKTIANTLPNPSLESGYFPIGIVNYKNYTQYQFEEEYKVYETGTTHEFPFKFIPIDFTTYTTLNGICELRRKSDGYMTQISCGISSVYMTAKDISYGKFYLEFGTSLSYPVFKWYNSSGEEVYSIKGSSISSTYSPNNYEYRIKYLYLNTTQGTNVEIYKEFNYEIDLSELTIDTTALNTGDVYEAEGIQISANMSTGNVIGKKINGESKDQKYELLKTRFGTIVSENTGLPLKYLTVLYSSSESKYYALLSDYPFSYYGYGGANYGIGFGTPTADNTSARIYFEVWESSDDISYEKSYVSVSSATASGNYKSTYTYSYIKACDKIHYTNYNMLVSFTASSYFTLEAGMERRKVGIPHVAHKTDEKPTIGSIGIGATIQFGEHRIENSPREKISFQILDYSNNLNTMGSKYSTYVKRPENTAMLEAVSNIDLLVHNVNISDATLQKANTTLFRWLNSEAPEGEWFSPISDKDLPPIRENLPTANQNGANYYRAGFLNTFSSQERDALVYWEAEDGYKGKVFLPQRGEEGYALANVVQPTFYRYGIFRRFKNFMDIFSHHPNSSTTLGTKTPKEMEYQYLWKRTLSGTGSYYIGSSSSWLGYVMGGVAPIIFLKEDLELEEVVNESDPYEVVYRVVLPELETFIDIGEADIVRYSTVDKDIISDIKKEIQIDALNIFDTEKIVNKMINALEKFDVKREVSKESIERYDLLKTLIGEAILNADIEVSKTIDTNDYYDISRYTSSSIADVYDIRKETLKVIADIFDSNREIVLDIIERYDIEKEVLANLIAEIRADILKEVIREEKIISDIAREVRVEDTLCHDILKNVEIDAKDIADIKRIIESSIVETLDTRRDIAKVEEAIVDIERSALVKIKERFDISIETLISLSTIYDIDTEIVREVVELFDNMRKMRGEDRVKGILLQEIVQTTDKYGLDNYLYKTIKEIKGNIYDVKNTVEQLPALVSEKTKYIVITREKNIKGDNVIEYDGKRYLIEAITRNRVFREIYLKEE